MAILNVVLNLLIDQFVTYQLLNDLLNQLPERVMLMCWLAVDVHDEFGNDLSISLRLKLVSLVLQEFLNVLVVGNDS